MTRSQLRQIIREELQERSYAGNLGAEEIFKFMWGASPSEIKQFERLTKQEKFKEAWRLIQRVTKTKLKGKEFENINIDEVSPPKWKGTVKAMMKHKDIDNPWALAWWMKKQGHKPHYVSPRHKKSTKDKWEPKLKPEYKPKKRKKKKEPK